MIDESVIQEAIHLLRQAAPSGSSLILFGSSARGETDEDSDLDFLVVEPQVADPLQEAVRLRQALRHLRVPVDVLVASRETFDYWRDTPNTVYNEAYAQGRCCEQVA
ncbi:MAG: nucleotidyltransferase domain-containing protein [Phycisphaeraceae bacterium]|nr:nucleotidyltransferase domain-containing protein [Phycisphaeraceae bacterium]